jgi:protein-tyrosine phosphatase
MAAAILSRFLAERGSALDVNSAGFVSEGVGCPAEVKGVMAPLGYDLSAHRSKLLTAGSLRSADLVLGMTRQHAVDVSLVDPSVWSRTFTISEVVRLGRTVPARHRHQSLTSWVTGLEAGGHRSRILGLPLSEDVLDPIGRPLKAYLATRDRLLDLTTRLADLVEPV